jgi:hypothetical protein
MALVCLPKAAVEKLKASALRGAIDVEKLYEMSSKERREYFTKFTDEPLGQFINTEFEKAMISKQQDALRKWAKMVFDPEAKSGPVYKTVLDKIKSLDELGVLNPESEKAFLEDLVTDKLGVRVTPDEVRLIAERATKIDAAQEKLGEDLGSPAKAQENLDYFIAKKNMDDYLQSLAPAGNLKVATGTIGRGMMLASVKSPLLNIGSNTEVGLTEAIIRRIASKGVKGADNQLFRDYVKMVNKVYQKTGYDLSRMTSLADNGASGARVLGETVHTQGKGVVRKVGRVVEDVVFKQMMGAPDVMFAAAHFADSANIMSAKLAERSMQSSREIMADAMRIKPQTVEGELVRSQAILDAETATWTNKTWASQASLGMRKIVNDLTGSLRLGDYLFPFVKTPANVIATGLDYAGLGLPKALFKTVQALRKGELGEKAYMQSAGRDIVRAGLGLTGAAAIVGAIGADNFVGAYDPSRAQYEQLRNSNYNAVRIAGKWISLDWFGPLSVPMTSMLYAQKYGQGKTGEKIWQYGQGVRSAGENLPGLSDIMDYAKARQYSKDQTGAEAADAAKDSAISQIYSRLVPSFFSDIATATDDKVRQTGKGVDGVKTKIPFLREHVPAKKDIFGRDIKTEPGASQILFGSRVKTDKETPVTKEIGRVSQATDKPINFTDWNKSSNKSLVQLKQKLGPDGFKKAQEEYGRSLEGRLNRIIGDKQYKDASDDEKIQILQAADSNAMNDVFKAHDFKPKKSDTKSTRNLLRAFK